MKVLFPLFAVAVIGSFTGCSDPYPAEQGQSTTQTPGPQGPSTSTDAGKVAEPFSPPAPGASDAAVRSVDAAVPNSRKRVFMTTTTYGAGELGSLASADARCAAAAAGLGSTRPFVAWLSVAGRSPNERIADGPYYAPDGTTVIFATKPSGPQASRVPRLDGSTSPTTAWTGAPPNGVVTEAVGGGFLDCGQWTSSAGAGMATNFQGVEFTACANKLPLACFEQ